MNLEEILFHGEIEGTPYLLIRMPKAERVHLSPREQEILGVMIATWSNIRRGTERPTPSHENGRKLQNQTDELMKGGEKYLSKRNLKRRLGCHESKVISCPSDNSHYSSPQDAP
jgi:hypothetical protein